MYFGIMGHLIYHGFNSPQLCCGQNLSEQSEVFNRMKQKNIAAEMLRNLLEENIRVFAKNGIVKLQLFSEKMQNLL